MLICLSLLFLKGDSTVGSQPNLTSNTSASNIMKQPIASSVPPTLTSNTSASNILKYSPGTQVSPPSVRERQKTNENLIFKPKKM